MIVRIVTCRVKPGMEEAFEAATTENHRGTVSEPGAFRFDVLKDIDSPGTYYLYEVYRDQAATVAHKETEHYRKWRKTVAELQSADRESVACSVVAPLAESDWGGR